MVLKWLKYVKCILDALKCGFSRLVLIPLFVWCVSGTSQQPINHKDVNYEPQKDLKKKKNEKTPGFLDRFWGTKIQKNPKFLAMLAVFASFLSHFFLWDASAIQDS